ncbi:hypothetical protein BOX15_Mlig005482g2, partial [Macrostomum lignano]
QQIMSTPSTSTTDSRLAEMTAKMTAREAEIRRRIEELRACRAEGKSEAEQYTAFEAAFDAERLAIVEDMEALESVKTAAVSTVEINNNLAAINDKIACLQRYHSDSVGFLPAYVSASAKAKVEELANKLADLRERVVPKKKFAFSSAASSNRNPKQQQPQQQPQKQQQQTQQPKVEPTLHNLTGKAVVLSDESVANKDILLSDLADCTIKVLSHPATLHLNGLTNCTILCGPVHRSVLIEKCTDFTLVVACHQLRLHSSTRCKLYLHVTSTPIIEYSNDVLIAPYNFNYANLSDHVTLSGLNWHRNQWDQVQDFNHLAGHVASPNWSIMPETDRLNWEE